MRLFVAVELGDPVLQRAAELVAELRQRVERRAPAARLTWVAGDRMHLTVRFIGEVDERQAAAVGQALRDPLPIEPFDLSWRGIGVFPPRGAPRVLWVGADHGAAQVRDLEREVSARLAKAGIAPEERAYRAHVTLARVREPGGLRLDHVAEGLEGVSLGASRVEATTLFRSELSPKGPVYVTLQRTPLRGGAPPGARPESR